MRRTAVAIPFYLLLAALLLLLAPAAQGRAKADPIVGTWANVEQGITITVIQTGAGQYTGDLKSAPQCSSFGSIGVHAWAISAQSGSTYTGTAMINIGSNGSDCWPEGSQQAAWTVSGSNLTLKTASRSSAWTKAGTGDVKAARDAAVRNAVRKAIKAVTAANLKLSKCKWGHCTVPAKRLWKVANQWWWKLSKMNAGTGKVASGLQAAITAMRYWQWVGQDVVHADAAFKAGNRTVFRRYYNQYHKHLNSAGKYQKRSINILWPS
jgi:hypothetical protein